MGGLGGSGYSREDAGRAPHACPGVAGGQPGPSLTLQRTLEPESCLKAPGVDGPGGGCGRRPQAPPLSHQGGPSGRGGRRGQLCSQVASEGVGAEAVRAGRGGVTGVLRSCFLTATLPSGPVLSKHPSCPKPPPEPRGAQLQPRWGSPPAVCLETHSRALRGVRAVI